MRAVVDIGSNSTKFLLNASQRGAEPRFKSKSVVTRLGRGVHTNRRFDPAALADTVAALTLFARKFKEVDCRDIVVVGTSAVRDAEDRDILAREVHKLFNVELRILTGLEEAEWSMKGAAFAAASVYPGHPLVFCEVGGASSQVGMFTKGPFVGHSFQAGAVRCHENLGLAEIPVPDQVWNRAKVDIAKFYPEADWIRLKHEWNDLARAQTVVIGGSLMLAARVAGAQPIGERGYHCPLELLTTFNDRLRRLPMDERLRLPHMEAGRADILCAGLLCIEEMMHRLGKSDFFVTGWGLRYGLIL